MQFDPLHQYIMNKPETVRTFPFGEDVHVYKVKNKMFALIGWHNLAGREAKQLMINLKCDPLEIMSLCDIFPSIHPGYHMNKKHWISIYIDPVEPCDVPQGEIERLIDGSFMLVVENMPKAQQTSIKLKL